MNIHVGRLFTHSNIKLHEASVLIDTLWNIFTFIHKAQKHTYSHTHTHRLNLRHREGSYVSIFSHCGSVSLSACWPASCKMEGEKYAFSGRLCETEDTALSFLFLYSAVVIAISVMPLFKFAAWCFFFVGLFVLVNVCICTSVGGVCKCVCMSNNALTINY